MRLPISTAMLGGTGLLINRQDLQQWDKTHLCLQEDLKLILPEKETLILPGDPLLPLLRLWQIDHPDKAKTVQICGMAIHDGKLHLAHSAAQRKEIIQKWQSGTQLICPGKELHLRVIIELAIEAGLQELNTTGLWCWQDTLSSIADQLSKLENSPGGDIQEKRIELGQAVAMLIS